MLYLLLHGDMPKPQQRRMLDALLVSASEHSVQAPTISAARIVQSAGNPLNASVATGVLAVGDHHAGSVEQAAQYFQTHVGQDAAGLVAEARRHKQRLAGYGHKIYDKDPRVEPLYTLAEELGVAGKYVAFSRDVETELIRVTGKPLHINIDGAMAAIILDLGFPWEAGRAFFILARVGGICAHAIEERIHEKPYRRVGDEDVNYTGPRDKKL
jgi:citrate synthase